MSEVTDPQSKRRTSGPGRLSSPGQDHRFQALLDSIPQLAWLADATGAAHWFNQRWYEFTGTSPDRGLRSGWGWVELIHPDHAKRVRARYRKCVGSGDSWEDTFPLRAADGSYSWFLSRAVPLVDENGELGGWLATSTDVSEQQEIEENRERLLVAERIARNEAERAREAAQSANKAKSEFLAMMSHELRTPLNGIVGYAQILDVGIAGELKEKQREYLGRLRRSADHLLALVNDILDLARIDARELSTNMREWPLSTPIADALMIAAPAAVRLGVTLPEAVDADRPLTFVGDADRVRQVMVNLLSNAIKFSDAGSSVEIETGITDDVPVASSAGGGGPWAFIAVRDYGIGIPADKQEAIFDPFVQAESGSTRSKGGTGLGLAISRRLARLMGGDLTVESSPGEGSTFTLWLPSPEESGDESPEDRGRRAREALTGASARSLGELGALLRKEVVDILDIWEARLHGDPLFSNLRALDPTQVQDHMLSFLGDVMQSLIIVERTGGLDSRLLDDGTEIQRTIASYHGQQRFRIGYVEEQLLREYALLTDVVVARLTASGSRDGHGGDDTRLAVGVVTRLLTHARAHSVAGFRQAREMERGS
jgi:PAS domain S-box-containing protein